MKHVVVDLEMNIIRQKSEARRFCTNETIEIGAVMLDDNLQEISSFRTYVKPEYNDGIVRKISKLTGITDEMVVHAPLFNEALRMFTNWCLGTGDEVTIYAWSDSDFNQIRKEIELKGYQISEAEKDILTLEWADFQKEFDAHLGFERQLSLNTALQMAGVDFKDITFRPLDEKHSELNVEVFVSPQFYGWIFGLGKHVQLVGPDDAVAEMKEMMTGVMEKMDSEASKKY